MSGDAFKAIINGGRSNIIPFWEVWFSKWKMQAHRWGDPLQIESTIKMSQELGMSAVNLKHLNLNTYFGHSSEASDGNSRYAGGETKSLEQLYDMPFPDLEPLVEELTCKLRKVRDGGLAGVIYMSWCFHAIASSMGLENFSYKLADDFEFVKASIAWVENRNRRAIKELIEHVKPDAILFDGDCAYKSGLMVSPVMFRQLVQDETSQTVAMLKKLKIPYTFHSDGKLDDVIPFLIDMGFGAIHGCEKAANELESLITRFNDDIALIGNMDVVFLTHAGVEQVRRETERMLIQGGQKGRFIAACNTSPQDYIPDENYLAFCDVIKNFA